MNLLMFTVFLVLLAAMSAVKYRKFQLHLQFQTAKIEKFSMLIRFETEAMVRSANARDLRARYLALMNLLEIYEEISADPVHTDKLRKQVTPIYKNLLSLFEYQGDLHDVKP